MLIFTYWEGQYPYHILCLISENQQSVNTPEIQNQHEFETIIAKLKQDHAIEVAKLREELTICKNSKTIGEYYGNTGCGVF